MKLPTGEVPWEPADKSITEAPVQEGQEEVAEEDCKPAAVDGVSGEGVLEELICPITRELPFEPVTAEDGRVYERWAIEEHLSRSNKSPMTNNRMGSNLAASPQVKGLITTLIDNGVISGDSVDVWRKRAREARIATVSSQAPTATRLVAEACTETAHGSRVEEKAMPHQEEQRDFRTKRRPKSHRKLMTCYDELSVRGGALYVTYNEKGFGPFLPECDWSDADEMSHLHTMWHGANHATVTAREEGPYPSKIIWDPYLDLPGCNSRVYVKCYPILDEDIVVAFVEVSNSFKWGVLPAGMYLIEEWISETEIAYVLEMEEHWDEIPDIFVEAASRAIEACDRLDRRPKTYNPLQASW